MLGAELRHLTLLFVRDYTRLIILANLIAWPITYWIANKWLEGYAYKVSISWTMFAGAALLTICIALITVSFQTIKAAIVNPVKSLRSE